MLTYLRPLLLLIAASITAVAAPTAPANNKARPVAPPPALPSTLEVVTFSVNNDGEKYKLIVTGAPAPAVIDEANVFGPQGSLMRVDVPSEAYSIIYNHQNEQYLGLEHSNYTYWEFSWPEIRRAVESSKRYASRLQELNMAGINTDSTPATTNAPATSSVSDTSGYVWKQTNDHKKVAGLDCVRWTGDTVSGDSVEAWCFNGPVPRIQTAVERLRVINEPMALVAIRPLVPPFVFPVFSALVRGGVTPVMISWGQEHEKNTFAFVEIKNRPMKPDLFSVPKLYMKTTLVSMDGLIDQKK